MTAREKIAFLNLRISLIEELKDFVREISLAMPTGKPKTKDEIWFEVIMTLLERMDEYQNQCRATIGKVAEIESDLAA